MTTDNAVNDGATEAPYFLYRIGFEIEAEDGTPTPVNVTNGARHLLYPPNETPVIPRIGEYLRFKSGLADFSPSTKFEVKHVIHAITPERQGEPLYHEVAIHLATHEFDLR